MFVHQLLDLPKLDYQKGFRLLKGRVVWENVHVNGDRKRIRISRTFKKQEFHQYVKPSTQIEIL